VCVCVRLWGGRPRRLNLSSDHTFAESELRNRPIRPMITMLETGPGFIRTAFCVRTRPGTRNLGRTPVSRLHESQPCSELRSLSRIDVEQYRMMDENRGMDKKRRSGQP